MTRQGALALALVLTAPAAGAVSLGEIEVRSYLGEPLDARIAVSPGAGESIRGACFSLARGGTPGVPRMASADLVLQRSASGTHLRIRSTAPVTEPAFTLGVAVACPGQAAQETKEYSVLVDPRTRTSAPTVATSRPPPVASTRLGTREGDTLESIANAIYPRDRAARASYLAALRDANPELAARGDREPIAPNAALALPDLRTFMQRGQVRRDVMPGASPSAAAELATTPAPARAPRRATPAPAPAPATAAPTAATPSPDRAAPERRVAAQPPAPSPRARASGDGFRLKLSGAEVDLRPSTSIDDRGRAQLRERLLMLDADDQVAAMLSMRNSLRQLEARVAELQLKLAGMPPSLAERTAPAPKPAPKVEAPPVLAPPAQIPVPAIPAPAKVEPAPIAAAPPQVEPAPKVETAPAQAVTPPKVDPPAKSEAVRPFEPPKTPRAVPKPAQPQAAALPDWLWSVVALLVMLALLITWYVMRRRRAEDAPEYYADEADVIAPLQEPADEIAPEHTPIYAEEPEPMLEAPPLERGVMTSDADLVTRIPEENPGDLRRRYIEERFPEIVTRMIVLEDPDSVVKGARLFYEDGALPRAVELLQFAVEAHPEEAKPWLALFEIFRLERLTGEFGALATRFRQQHGESEHWRKVQYFGREIDPANPLYQEAPINTLETIGPREARRLAAASSFDPVAENWLNAPMDFDNAVLANELRMVLMQKAGLTEEDLVANPMPALRNVEMFNVA